jgi:hypothetical protein
MEERERLLNIGLVFSPNKRAVERMPTLISSALSLEEEINNVAV